MPLLKMVTSHYNLDMWQQTVPTYLKKVSYEFGIYVFLLLLQAMYK